MGQNEGEVDFEATYSVVTPPATIKINSVDVTDFCINFIEEIAFGDILTEINLKFTQALTSAVALTVGQTLEVWIIRDDPNTPTKVFSGFVQQISPDGGFVNVNGFDKLWTLVRSQVNHIYDSTVDASAGKLSAIFQDLVVTYGGLTADATTVQDSGTTYILGKFVCDNANVYERCDALAVALNWQFYYRADTDKVYFEPKGFPLNANVLTVGDNVTKVPTWLYDTSQLVNDITIVGASQLVETTETGLIGTTAGYTTASVLLTQTPDSVKVFWDGSNPPTTLKIGGAPQSTVTYDYFVDITQKKILPATGTTFPNANYFQIQYSLIVPISVELDNQASISLYGSFKKTQTYTDIKTELDAETRATNYLAKYSSPFISATLRVHQGGSLGLQVGQAIKIIDTISKPTVNANAVINKIRIRYPIDYDEIDVGDSFWRLADSQAAILQKFKLLEAQEFANTSVANILKNTDNKTGSPIPVRNRYSQLLTQTPSGTGMWIVGDSIRGIVGTMAVGNSNIGSETLVFCQQAGNYYQETFFDNDFKDAGNTTATWNNATPALTFTSGQVGQSTTIDFGNGTITEVTLTVVTAGGSFTLAVSADGGSNWTLVTSGVPAAIKLANQGTDLRWRITENASSTGTVTSLIIAITHGAIVPVPPTGGGIGILGG